jgi:Ca2+-binding EF-hand superfamily protein
MDFASVASSARLTTASMDRLSMGHSSHAAKQLGLDRASMRTLSAAERVAAVRAKIEDHHDDEPEDAVESDAATPAPTVVHTRDTMKTLSHVERVAAVMQHLDDGVSHEELGKIHGTTSVQGLSEDSHAFVKGGSSGTRPPPPSPAPGGTGAADTSSGKGPGRTVSQHAQSALDAHASKMDAMKHLLLSVKMLREKPLLTSKLQEMGRVLAKKMDENPTTASALEADDVEAKLRQAFDGIMDEDHSGQLEYGEFKHGLSVIGLDLGDDVRELFEAIDTDDSGTVDVQEFIAAISAAKNVRAAGPAAQYQHDAPGFSHLSEADSPRAAAADQAPAHGEFSKHDVDHDGKLNRAELAAFLNEQGFEVEEDYVTDLLKRYGGGVAGAGVSEETFPYLWQHINHSDEEGVRTVSLPVHKGGFGFELVDGLAGTGAVLVSNVQQGSGAETAGILEGDEAVMVGQELLRNVGLQEAQEMAQTEAELATELEAARSKAGGRYRALKDAPVHTQASASTGGLYIPGMRVSEVKTGTNLEARETSRDEKGVEWVHIDLGWAPTKSEEGEQLIIRTDGKASDSGPITVEWKFGPQHAPAEEMQRSDAERLRELQNVIAEAQGELETCSEAERPIYIAQIQDLEEQMRDLGWTPSIFTPDQTAAGETEEQLREKFEDYDLDQDEALTAQELQMMLLDLGMTQDEVTAEYIHGCLEQYGDSDRIDFAGFTQLYRSLTGQEDAAAGAPPESQGQPSAPLTQAEIEEKFNQYDQDRDGLLTTQDVLGMLVAEFGYSNDETTDGVVDGLMAQFAQFDANGDGSIDINEFFPLWEHFSGFNKTMAPLPNLTQAELDAKFTSFDTDGDGLLTDGDVMAMVMSECGYDDGVDTQEFVQDIMGQVGQFDTNGDGSIDISEFPALWTYLMDTVNGQMGEGAGAGGEGVEQDAWANQGGMEGEAQQALDDGYRDCWVPRDPNGIGVIVDDQPSAPAEITRIDSQAAEDAGLVVGDIIVEVDGVQVTNGAHAVDELSRAKAINSADQIRLVVQSPVNAGGYMPQEAQPPTRAGGRGGGGMFACLGPARQKSRARARNPT